MKILTFMIIGTGFLANTALVRAVNFDQDKVGEAPAGWTATQTGSGKAKWTVEQDDSAPSAHARLPQERARCLHPLAR